MIVDKSNQFARNLQLLTAEYDHKSSQVEILQDEASRLRSQLADLERQLSEKWQREVDTRLASAADGAFQMGRRQAEEEMSLENRKLREVIDSLRAELGVKSKRLIELQFEQEELQKGRRKQTGELEEC